MIKNKRQKRSKSKAVDPTDPILGIQKKRKGIKKKNYEELQQDENTVQEQVLNTSNSSTNIVINGDINPTNKIFGSGSSTDNPDGLSINFESDGRGGSESGLGLNGLNECGLGGNDILNPLKGFDNILNMGKVEKYVSEQDQLLNDAFGPEDIISECFMCNYNEKKYPNIPTKFIDALNSKAFEYIENTTPINAVHAIYKEFENMRNHLNRLIEVSKKNDIQCCEIEEWLRRSIRWHFYKHCRDKKVLENKFDSLITDTTDVIKENIIIKETGDYRRINEKYIKYLESIVNIYKKLHK